MTLDLANLDLSLLPPVPGGAPESHFVELYEDDRSLVESVRTFVSIGIARGEAAVVVATPFHRVLFESELGRTLDLDAARTQGLYVTAAAEETLALFMRDGSPDAALFEEAIGSLLDVAGRDGRKVRVFGEMVAALWAGGNRRAALELEQLWNELAERRSFRLFCAYGTGAFDDDDLEALTAIAGQHSHVVVPERPGV
jgi:hypothetical protein